MIPKIIHYCWFGGNEFDNLIKKCIKSWKRYCPEYEIKEWNEDNFSIEENIYLKEAYQMKKWAFVSDYVRLKVLYEYGGIYMDTDVEVLKPLDELLYYNAFSGFESKNKIPTATMGARKRNPWIKELLNYYENRRFILSDGRLDMKTNVEVISEITKKRYEIKLNGKFQIIGDEIAFFPMEYLCAKEYLSGNIQMTKNTYTIHHFSGSWVPKYEKTLKGRYPELQKFFGSYLARKILVCLSIYHVEGLKGIVMKVKEKIN